MTDWLTKLTAHGMPVTFHHPRWLLLIPVLWFGSWLMAHRSLAGGARSRRVMQLLIRCVVLALLAGALAEPHLTWKASEVAVVAVVDVSDSVPPEQRKMADRFLAASQTQRPARDRIGLVTVARQAYVQSLPSVREPPTELGATGTADASNLQQGIDLARVLFPSDAAGRVLLISDGNETVGSLNAAATTLLGAGVPIDVAGVEYDRSGMVRMEDIVMPAWARDGDTITARIVMNAGRAAGGRLSLLLDGQAVAMETGSAALSTRIDLTPGVHVFSQSLRLPPGAVHKLEAVFEPDDKAAGLPQLMRAQGVTFTSSRGRVLVLTEDATAAAPFVSYLASDNFNVEVKAAAHAPVSLEDWSTYDAIVLADEPAFNFSQAQQQEMAQAVHDSGVGLLVLGGPQSYGAGGWIGSPLAEAFPVLLDPPQKRQIPMGALAIVIDRSGSMETPVLGTNMTQQQIANEAAVLGIRALSRLDEVAVIAFSGDSEVVVPLTRADGGSGIPRRVKSITPGGGTNLFPALDTAALELSKSRAGVKHIIVLTDGETGGDREEGLAKARALQRAGITLSTVAIGDLSNDSLLRKLAAAGGGRDYAVKSEASRAVLPQIFIKESQTIRRSLIWEGSGFVPSLSASADSLGGRTGPFPAITGYIVTADRGGLSTVALRGPEGDPILAQWQHGLGRVTAYTSDAATRWNAAWAAWGSAGAFWQQQVKWVMRPSGDSNARVTLTPHGDTTRVVLDLHDADGELINFASVQARVAPPSEDPFEPATPRDVSFHQTGPGRYEAEVESGEAGSHLLSVRYDAAGSGGANADSRSGSVRAAIVRRGSDEFRAATPNNRLLWDIAGRTNGHIYKLDSEGADLWSRDHLRMPEFRAPVWLAVVFAAIALFLLDVAVRRIAIDWQSVLTRVRGVWSATPVVPHASLGTLSAARARAGAAIARAEAIPLRQAAAVREGVKPISTKTIPITPVEESGTQRPAPPANRQAAPRTAPSDMMSRLKAAKGRSQPRDGE